MTITNQTNPVGTQYESDKSLIRVPRKGNPFVVENTFTTTRLTKTSNNPPTYRKEIFQHSSAKDEGNVVQIGVVNDKGEIEFNSQLDTGNGNEELMKEQIQKQLKTQTKNAETKISDKVSSDTESLFISEELRNPEKKGVKPITEEDVENGLGGGRLDDSRELRELNARKDKLGARDNKNTYGVLFYPSFIETLIEMHIAICKNQISKLIANFAFLSFSPLPITRRRIIYRHTRSTHFISYKTYLVRRICPV